MTATDIRPLKTIPEFEQVIRLEQQIWELPAFEALSADTLLVASKVGGQVFGAFDQDQMVGFVLAFPGIKPNGKAYLHSHMLGVLASHQNRGLGRAMKLQQRADALARGFDLIEWTFDPLELKNAHFNTERLGAIVGRYSLNEYGVTGSTLHGGLPTDRCVAEWRIAAPEVEKRLAGERVPRGRIEERIEIPVTIMSLRRDDPEQARKIQRRVSEQFLSYFERGLAVVGFELSDHAGTYLLRRQRPEVA